MKQRKSMRRIPRKQQIEIDTDLRVIGDHRRSEPIFFSAAVFDLTLGCLPDVFEPGSAAALIQSTLYGGATCGVFSFQSVGATIAAPALSTIVAAGGSAVAGGVAIGNEMMKDPGDGGSESSESGHGGDDTAHVECSCARCVCDASCQCDCRRGRGRH